MPAVTHPEDTGRRFINFQQICLLILAVEDNPAIFPARDDFGMTGRCAAHDEFLMNPLAASPKIGWGQQGHGWHKDARTDHELQKSAL